MDNNTLVVLLSTQWLVLGVLAFGVASLFRKVGQLMATQAELKNALTVTDADLDAVKVVVDKLVAAGGAPNVMTQAELDAFVAQAQAVRVKADAVVEAIKPLDPGNPPPTLTGGPFGATRSKK